MSSKLSQLCDKYQAIVFFDTETTGLDPSVDQIIELAAVRITRNQAGFLVLDEKMDAFVKLLEGQKLPDKIVELTHITDEMIQKDGVDATAAASAFNNLIRGRTLLVAHNAQFDLLFSRALLHYTDIGTARLDACDYIDSLTVYKDRAAYPHKLANAIEHYSLEGKVKNSQGNISRPELQQLHHGRPHHSPCNHSDRKRRRRSADARRILRKGGSGPWN